MSPADSGVLDRLSEYRGPRGLNFFEEDELLKKTLRRLLPKKNQSGSFSKLSEFGALCGGRLGRLIEAAHRPERLPRLRSYDAVGNRIDAVEYCAEQLEAKRLLAEAFYGSGPPDFFTRMTLAYLANQNGEGGITCPLAMTEGLIGLLEDRGSPDQKKRFLPLLRSAEPETALTAGQFVTERQGGSNVAANETKARKQPDGNWSLTGLKWFCSNPGELWVTTAKVEESQTVGLFLAGRRLKDGKLNGLRILRLKEIAGTRGKATAEVEYEGTRAELIGRPSQGMALLNRWVLGVSRIHAAASALGMMRRALLEAEMFSKHRLAYGRPIVDIPYVSKSLENIRQIHSGCLVAFYEALACVEKKRPAAEILVPLLKIELTQRASWAVREAQLLIGGHGILEDFSILPRLAQDALVNEIWEGTHPVLAEHAAKALRRPACLKDFQSLLGPSGKSAAFNSLSGRVEKNRSMTPDERSLDNLELCSIAFKILSSALLSVESAGRA